MIFFLRRGFCDDDCGFLHQYLLLHYYCLDSFLFDRVIYGFARTAVASVWYVEDECSIFFRIFDSGILVQSLSIQVMCGTRPTVLFQVKMRRLPNSLCLPSRNFGSMWPVTIWLTLLNILYSLRVLGVSDGIENMGSMRLELFGCLVLAWILVYFIIWKGINQSGYVITCYVSYKQTGI